jgi:anti-sigma regulatory factor (Ser/Thr protein kinase)
MSTRGVQLKDVTPIDRDPDDPQDGDTPKSGGIGSVTIEKLADTVIIEKEADTDKVVSDMVAKFKKLLPNMT